MSKCVHKTKGLISKKVDYYNNPCNYTDLKQCQNFNYFSPMPRAGYEKTDKNMYRNMRVKVLNAQAKVDCNPMNIISKMCKNPDEKIFEAKNKMVNKNKKTTVSLVKEMMAPASIDCWNYDYIDYMFTKNLDKLRRYQLELSNSSKMNLDVMWKCYFAVPTYSRAKQLKEWERYMIKSKCLAVYSHAWKDPFYTTDIIKNKSIKKPKKSETDFWIKYPDVRMIDYRGGVDWDPADFKRIMREIDKMACEECPETCD